MYVVDKRKYELHSNDRLVLRSSVCVCSNWGAFLVPQLCI